MLLSMDSGYDFFSKSRIHKLREKKSRIHKLRKSIHSVRKAIKTAYLYNANAIKKAFVFGLMTLVLIFGVYSFMTKPVADTSIIQAIKQTKQYVIPKRIFLNSKIDICNVTIPSYQQQKIASNWTDYFPVAMNVQRIKGFNPNFEVICYDDDMAYNYLKEKDETLAKYYRNETDYRFRADIFRVVALYYEGGYYMDQDMESTMPLMKILKEDTTFVSVQSYWARNFIFNSFMGATAFNEILKINIDIIRNAYENDKERGGCEWLRDALLQFTNETFMKDVRKKKVYKDQRIHLMEEKRYVGPNAREILHERKAQPGWKSAIQWAVYDEATKLWPFWSRINGYRIEK